MLPCVRFPSGVARYLVLHISSLCLILKPTSYLTECFRSELAIRIVRWRPPCLLLRKDDENGIAGRTHKFWRCNRHAELLRLVRLRASEVCGVRPRGQKSHGREGQDQTLITFDNRKIWCPGTILMTRPLSWLTGRRWLDLRIHILNNIVHWYPFCAGIQTCVTLYVTLWMTSSPDRCWALQLFARYPGNPLCAQLGVPDNQCNHECITQGRRARHTRRLTCAKTHDLDT